MRKKRKEESDERGERKENKKNIKHLWHFCPYTLIFESVLFTHVKYLMFGVLNA